MLDPLAGSGGGDVDGSLPQHGRKSFLPLTVVAHRGGRTLRPKAFSSPAVSGPSPPAQRNSRPRIIGRYVTALTPLRRARTPCRLRYPGCPGLRFHCEADHMIQLVRSSRRERQFERAAVVLGASTTGMIERAGHAPAHTLLPNGSAVLTEGDSNRHRKLSTIHLLSLGNMAM